MGGNWTFAANFGISMGGDWALGKVRRGGSYDGHGEGGFRSVMGLVEGSEWRHKPMQAEHTMGRAKIGQARNSSRFVRFA